MLLDGGTSIGDVIEPITVGLFEIGGLLSVLLLDDLEDCFRILGGLHSVAELSTPKGGSWPPLLEFDSRSRFRDSRSTFSLPLSLDSTLRLYTPFELKRSFVILIFNAPPVRSRAGDSSATGACRASKEALLPFVLVLATNLSFGILSFRLPPLFSFGGGGDWGALFPPLLSELPMLFP